MNVVAPTLKPADYARANYAKREVEHMRRYVVAMRATGETGKAELLCDWLEAAAAKLRTDLSNPTDEA